MIFLNPFVWGLFPLILSPFLWYFKFFKKKRRRIIPSIFFAKKVTQIRKARSIKNVLLELFLEILFLLSLLVILAQPSSSNASSNQKSNLVIFIDNTLSMGHNVEARNAFYKKKVDALMNLNQWEHVELFDATMMIDSHATYAFVNEEDVSEHFNEFFKNVSLEWRSFQYEDLQAYLDKSLTFGKHTYAFCLLTDYKSNHFEDSFELKDMAVIIDEKPWSSMSLYPIVTRDLTVNKTYFLGEEVPIEFEMTSSFATGDYNVEIVLGEKRIYLDTLSFRPRQRQMIRLTLGAKSAGVVKLRLMIKKDKEVVYEYFSAYKVLPRIFMEVHGSKGMEKAFKNALLYDFNEGHVSFKKSAATSVTVFLDPTEQELVAWNALKRTVLFLDAEKGITFWNNFLGNKGFSRFSVQGSFHFSSNAVRLEAKQILGEVSPLFKQIGELSFLVDTETLVFGHMPEEARTLLSVNDIPLMFLYGNVLVFPFAPNGGETSLFESPEGLILFYEGLFELVGRKALLPLDAKALEKFVDQASVKSPDETQEAFFRDKTPGIYEREKDVFIVNIDPSEVNAPVKKSLKPYFKQRNVENVDAFSELHSPNKRLAHLFSFKGLLKVLCIAILTYLMISFLRRNRLIGKMD